ncbi:MAG: immunoglobulin domain-containing protein [Opitutae bacterium]|nr:immunoglobulin domain-containing protein [Opitutae bacterium]
MSSFVLSLVWKFRRVQLPALALIALLQRTPIVRLLLCAESVVVRGSLGQVLRSTALVATAVGAVDTLAGATTFSATPASPASATTGAAFQAAFAVTGAPSTVKSYTISNLPPGLSVTGATASGADLLLNASNGTISGTPTTAGNYAVSIKAWEKVSATGKSVSYSYTINVTGGVVVTAPSITTQPSSQTVTAGGGANFAVTASGTDPLAYQWRKDGAAISGAASATYSIASTTTADAGTYTVVVSNSAGSVTSNGATLTVNAAASAPSITTQPSNQSATTGGSVSFSVTASGTAPLSYQWRKDGANLPGATSSTYSIASVTSGDAGTYSVVVSNSVGNATSNGATLTVTASAVAPTIATQPASQTVNTGASVTFSVTASGTAPLSYQWRKDGAAIAGAVSASFTIASAATSDAGAYTVVATNSAGSATSNSATLTVNTANTATAPSITTQPAAQTVNVGASVSFIVAASGTAPLSYEWRKDGATIAGATSSTFTIAAAANGDAGTYSVVVSNSAGSATSNGATLTVNSTSTATAPSITTQPASVTVSTGQSATFSVAATGTAPLSYQWRKDGAAIAGATSASYTIAAVTSNDAGAYSVVVSNSAGTATSNSATLAFASTASIFPHLTALAFDGAGRLYATDSTNDTIRRIAADGTVYLVAGSTGNAGSSNGSGAAALFNQPGGLVATNDGILYVADTANAVIRRIATDGSVTTFAGNSALRGNTNGNGTAATFSAPTGIALDSSGNLYVADATNHTIRKITSAGAVTTYAGQPGTAGSANGSAASAKFNHPAAVAVDGAGNVYVADTNNNTIRKISAAGNVTTLAGVSGVSGAADGRGADALFNQPQGLAIDAAGNLHVADTGNSSVRRITPAGVVTTIAGLSTISRESDDEDDDPKKSANNSALFNHPLAVAISPSGMLYVGDTGAGAVRTVAADGTVTTLALTLGQSSGGSTTGGASSGNPSGTSSGGTSGSAASGGGGGGAPSLWLPLAVSLAFAVRRWRRTVGR